MKKNAYYMKRKEVRKIQRLKVREKRRKSNEKNIQI